MSSVARHLLAFCLLLAATAACTSHNTSSHASLENSYWKLVELNGKPVAAFDHQQEAHIILRGGNPAALSGSGGCNRLLGSYTLSGTTIDFSNTAMTMMACAEGMDTEQAFVRTLEGKKSWVINGDTLILTDQQKKTVARFRAVYLR